MENNQRKAFETAYGASVISAQPVVGPPIMSGQTMPGTGQLCGPCKTGGYCPVHGDGVAGSPKVLVEGEPRKATFKELIGASVANFLDEIVEHVADRVTEKMHDAQRAEAMKPQFFEGMLLQPTSVEVPYVDLRLRELQLALAEHDILSVITARGQHVPSGLMVACPTAPAMYLHVTTDNGWMFSIWLAGGPLSITLEGVVDFFVTYREPLTAAPDESAES